MWISGKISLKTEISQSELLEKFPKQEAKIIEEKIVVETNKIPFFADHKLVITTLKKNLYYRLSVPSLGPFVFFMYLAVIFLTGFTNWKTLVVGGIVVTGIAFAVYVINDKGARGYIQKYIKHLEEEEELVEKISPAVEGSCPACGTVNSPYSKKCVGCGLSLKSKKIKSVENHTGSIPVKIKYKFDK
jgi:hypothetical protein